MPWANRLELHHKLVELLGSSNVYYQPPETVKLRYPCVLYSIGRKPLNRANNKTYTTYTQYEVTLIYKDPDSDLPDKLLNNLEGVAFDRIWKVDNLYHMSFTTW